MKTSKVEAFLTSEEEAQVIAAICEAERNTSGEIRVHLEPHATIDPFERAAEVFDLLAMHETKNRNGVLIYVAVEDRTLVILGDKGINDVVPVNFWESTKDTIIQQFKIGAIKQGLVNGILKAGEQLKSHFPYKNGDPNELSNEISTH